MCLNCARLGERQPNCSLCVAIAPVPRHQIVRNIIERYGHQYRLSQIESEAQHEKDFAASRNIERELLDAQIKCTRRRKKHEQMLKDLEAR